MGYGSGARALERSSDREQLEFAYAKSRRQTATPSKYQLAAPTHLSSIPNTVNVRYIRELYTIRYFEKETKKNADFPNRSRIIRRIHSLYEESKTAVTL